MTERERHEPTGDDGCGGYCGRVPRAAVFVAVALLVCLLTVSLAGTAAAQTRTKPDCSTVGYDGSGTADDPFLVSNVSQLQCMNQDLDAHYRLVSDIDASVTKFWEGDENFDEKGFEPVGRFTDEFTGSFNGSGHKISNLFINRPDQSEVGLFGGTNGARIKNVALVDANILGQREVGGIVGFHKGVVKNSYVSGNIKGTSDFVFSTESFQPPTKIGGIVGFNGAKSFDPQEGTVKNSYSTASVFVTDLEGTQPEDIGGVVGSNGGTVNSTYAIGRVDGAGTSTTAGLVGTNFGTVENSYWDKLAVATGQSDGIGDKDEDGTVTNVTGFDTNNRGRADEMTGADAKTRMPGFDFTDTWGVVEDPATGEAASYPFLRSNQQEPKPGLPLYAAGSGTPSDPFVIETWTHLNNVGEDLPGSFELGADLNSTTEDYDEFVDNPPSGFDPIGSRADAFTGTFDGTGHTIADVRINRTESIVSVSLFSDIGSGGIVENLRLDNVDVDVRQADDSDFDVYFPEHGTLAGTNIGTIRNVVASGTVDSEISTTGGLVSVNGGTINRSAADVDVEGPNVAGGLVGEKNAGIIKQSFATGNVTSDVRPGGLVGAHDSGTIADSFATGSVRGDTDVGGLIGRNDGTVKRSYAAGNVTAPTDDESGGLIGDEGFATTYSNNYWDVNATGQQDAGGFGAGASEGLTTEEMTGDAAPGNMTGFDFNPTWVTTDSYPELFWSVEKLALDAPDTLTLGETAPAPSFFDIVDGRTPSVTGVANYSSSDTSVITVSSPLEAVGLGNSTVTAEHFGFADSEEVKVGELGQGGGKKECINRRNLSRGERDESCPKDRTIERGGSREELDRETGRRSDTSRRDRSRRNRGR